MKDDMYGVRQEQYPTVICEMIRHENEFTNHRIMWLLVGQGFLANAYVSVKNQGVSSVLMLGLVGMLASYPVFVMLYQSYQATGYLQFLGQQTKQGTLQAEHLPLIGWPRNRIKVWGRNVGVCPWISQARDLSEPWLLLAYLFTSMWMMGLLRAWTRLNTAVSLTPAALLSAALLSASCLLFLAGQGRPEHRGMHSGLEGRR